MKPKTNSSVGFVTNKLCLTQMTAIYFIKSLLEDICPLGTSTGRLAASLLSLWTGSGWSMHPAPTAQPAASLHSMRLPNVPQPCCSPPAGQGCSLNREHWPQRPRRPGTHTHITWRLGIDAAQSCLLPSGRVWLFYGSNSEGS